MSAISDTPKVVVGLDFGTTYSGFAFAHRADPDDVQLFYEWPKASRPYCKTQTSIFYSLANAGTYELQDWGWNSLEKYTAALQIFRSGWANKQPFPSAGRDIKRAVGVFVTHFKLLLAETEAQSSFCEKLPVVLTAEKLIVDYLRCMCDFTITHLKQKYGKSFSKREVQWCLTVPAIWSESSKKKMQSYAEKAELVAGKECFNVEASIYPLRIILEPEAASFYCQKQLRDDVSLNKRDKFIVADIGGGTIDIVVHKKAEHAHECMKVHEVSASSGELGGGTFVDRNFFQFLKEKIGCFQKFSEENPESLLRILNWWLGPRGKSTFDGTGSKMLEVPLKLRKVWMKHDRELGLAARSEEDYDELEISEQAMKGMFDTEVQKAIELIDKQLTSSHIKYVFLVGGFSENPYLVQEIKNRFKGAVEDVIAPPNPGAAICKGAVAIGRGTGVVLSRISKRWYGIDSARLFQKFVDPPSYMFEDDDGIERCDNFFRVFIKKGESVLENRSVTHIFCPVCQNQKLLQIDLISCTSDDKPRYTTDPGCEKMETYSFDIDEDLHLGKYREVRVSMYFGRSSIEVSVQRVNFGKNRAPEKLYSVEFDAAGSYVNK